MAAPTKTKDQVKNIPIVTMCSSSDIRLHGGKQSLTAKFRQLRDQTTAECKRLTDNALNSVHDEVLTNNK